MKTMRRERLEKLNVTMACHARFIAPTKPSVRRTNQAWRKFAAVSCSEARQDARLAAMRAARNVPATRHHVCGAGAARAPSAASPSTVVA
ncbi:MAG TPA: hypothetical protein VGN31_08880 [Paraburkholderia sp.]